MTSSFPTGRSLAVLLALVALPAFAQTPPQPQPAPQARDEPQQFNAFAVVQATGPIVRGAEKQAVIAASLKGSFFIETGEGPVPSGTVTCAGAVNVDMKDSHQTGAGACTFTAADGAVSWGEWKCEGYNLVGCRGPFKVNGGTGRLAGLVGEATMIWRPSGHEVEKQPDGTVLQNTSGILIWRDFKLTKK